MATYTDGFTGTNATALATHDANWTGFGSGIGTLQLLDGQLSGQGNAYYAQPVGDPSYVQAKVGLSSDSGTFMYLWLRREAGVNTTNGIKLGIRKSGATYLYDSTTATVWSDATAYTAGDVVRMESEGTTLRIYKNGSLLHTYSGLTTAHSASKYPGITQLTATHWDDFEAGDLVAANQTASPTSDITVGSWSPSTGAVLYAVIDEVTPADADYIYTTSAGAACEVKLAAVSQPDTGACTLSYRLYSTSADNIQVDLIENTTVRQTWNHNPAPTTVTQYDQTITTPANITDWANLRVRFTATAAA